jgi:hypothetical protein
VQVCKVTRRALIASALSLASPAFARAQENIDTSIIRLIVSPEKYQGQVVRLIGFLRLEFEGDAIYLHQDDYIHNITKNGLWVDRNDLVNNASKLINDRYVLIEGTFDAHLTGHFGMWSGGIVDVRRITPWETRP